MEANQNLLNVYKEYSHDLLRLDDDYHEFKSNYYAYLSGSKLVDEKTLLKSYTDFSERHHNTLLKVHLSDMEPKPENYIRQLTMIQTDMAGIMDIIAHRDRVVTEKSQAYVAKTLDAVQQSLESLGYSFYSEEQERELSEVKEEKEAWLYWSVLAIGLSGFLLVVLNSDKLRKLKLINEEKKLTLGLLTTRLAAMEASRDGIGLIDKDGNLTYMNNALMKLHNIPEDEVSNYINQPWESLYAQEGREEILEGRREIQKAAMVELKEKSYWRGESPIAIKDGEVVNAELSLTLLPEGGFVGTVRDISERLRTDKEKKELESQFYQAQKMEAIGRLAGGIAHDFNNILAAMNGYAEFLMDDLEESSPQHKFAANILQAGRQARDLVDQMLAFSRRKESSKDSLDLTIPVHETLSMLQATLPKTIEVNTKIETKHAPINGNASQIAQAIMNLCVNAKDAIEDEHGTLTVGLDIVSSDQFDVLVDELPAEGETPPIRFEIPQSGHTRLILGHMVKGQEYVCLSVEDSGSGMSQVIMEHIFEPFFTTKPVDKGTGLGLATVHGVVASHRGAMVIDSTLGKGTRFDLLFPLAEGAVLEEVPDQAQVFAEGGSGCILLVEDQGSVRDMMMNMLERLGYEAAACVSGLEALEVLRENPGAFDLVLTDHNMPKMTGLELVQQIHMDFPDLPFILLSGYSEQKLKDMMHEHPAIKAVLRKPIAKHILSEKIQAVLTGH